jgi:hypothetical protein
LKSLLAVEKSGRTGVLPIEIALRRTACSDSRTITYETRTSIRVAISSCGGVRRKDGGP